MASVVYSWYKENSYIDAGLGSASIMDETNIHVVEEEAMLTGDDGSNNITEIVNLYLQVILLSPI